MPARIDGHLISKFLPSIGRRYQLFLRRGAGDPPTSALCSGHGRVERNGARGGPERNAPVTPH